MTLQQTLQNITIFGRDNCGFCTRAKELCENKSLNYRYIDIIAEKISKADLEKTVGQPVQTVPQIFHGKTYIGGFQEFSAWVIEQETQQAETSS